MTTSSACPMRRLTGKIVDHDQWGGIDEFRSVGLLGMRRSNRVCDGSHSFRRMSKRLFHLPCPWFHEQA